MLRSGVVLLAASVVRLGCAWVGNGDPSVPAAEDRGTSVARAADSVADLDERRSRPLGPGERIDLNRADSIDLDRLPRVGPGLARRMVDARAASGGFRTWADLLAVPGIGPATLDRLRPHVDPLSEGRSGPKPTERSDRGEARVRRVALNSADAQDLQRVPGIGPVLAERIVADRRRHGPYPDVQALVRVPGIGPATVRRLRPHVRIPP